MDHSYICILLLAVGLVLIVAEIFLPTGGMIGICATGCILGSIWYAWLAWSESSPTIWWSYLALILFLVPITIGGTFYLLPRTPIGKILFHEGFSSEEITPFEKEQNKLTALVGETGKTLTLHNPGGMVLVDGSRYHSESEGVIIEPDRAVEVVEIHGNRLKVREYDPESVSETTSHPESQVSQEENQEDTDFDMNLS